MAYIPKSAFASFTGLGPWEYKDETGTNPSSGTFRFNNGTITSATKFYLSDEDKDGADKGFILNQIIVATDRVYLPVAENWGDYVFFTVDTVTDQGSWIEYDISSVSVGAGGPSDGEVCVLNRIV